jgi:hypothetical protein
MGTHCLASPLWNAVCYAEAIMHVVLAIGCIVLAVTALVKCLPKNPDMFFVQSKRTKGFWTAMTGGAVALTLLGFLGIGPFGLLFLLAGACMAAVYLADVNPAVSGKPDNY